MVHSIKKYQLGVIDAYHQCHFEFIDEVMKQKDIAMPFVVTGTALNFKGDQNLIKTHLVKLNKNSTVEEAPPLLFPKHINPLIEEEWVLDEALILNTKNIESYFLRISDRTCAEPIPVYERRQYYLLLLNHYTNIIQKHQLTHVLSFDTPHSTSSIVFYKLCEHFNIKCIQIEYHTLTNYSVIFEGYKFPRLPIDYLNEETASSLEASLSTRIKKALKEKSAYLTAYKKKDSKAFIKKSPFQHIVRRYRFIEKATMNLTMGILPLLFKKEVKHFTAFNQIEKNLQYRRLINKPLNALLKKNCVYNQYAKEPNIETPFIYFGMHMQPEKTSQPMGGEYDMQLLPIIMLSKALPEGWQLLVKEHPNQFNKRKITNNNYRSHSFYKALSLLKNVTLVPLSYSSDLLIERAQIVSTLTGTIGWEALKLGIPTMVFGETYYKACNKMLLQYIHYYDSQGFLVEAGHNESTIEFASLPRKQQIQNMASSIIKSIQNEDSSIL